MSAPNVKIAVEWLAERRRLAEPEQPSPAQPPLVAGPTMRLITEIRESRAEYSHEREDAAKRAKAICASVDAAGCTRSLAGPHGGQAADALEALRRTHPNFWQVIEHLQREAILSGASGRPLMGLRLLLVGPPGVGKTDFALSLASVLSLPPPLVIDMSTAQTNSDLAGSSTYWSNSAPGRLFEALLESSVGNPLVVLDEIDKVREIYGQPDPRSPLYGLWETSTARRWSDLSVPWVTLDLTAINWIATANYLDVLPRPLVSRAQVFEIRPPTSTESLAVVQSVYARLLAERQLHRWVPAHVGPRLARQLAGLPPRQVRKRLESALVDQLVRRPQTCLWH